MITRRFARALALGLLTLVLMACAGTPGPSAVTDPGSPAPTAAPPAGEATPGPDVLEAIAFREQMGLRADLGWVQAVAANPDATLDWGVPLLPFEAAELERRPTGESDLVAAVQAYLAEHADEAGGVYLDQANGGIVTMLVTGDAAAHESAIREVIGDAPLVVRQVRWTEAELNNLQERLFADLSFYETIPAAVSSAATDVIANQVVLDISSAAPNAGQRIAEHFGAADGRLKVVSDGTGILLLPTGRIEGRIIVPAGTDFSALSPQYESDVPIGPRDAVGIGVGPDGTFTIDRLPPTGYRVYLLELGANGNREAGEVRVTVPPGGVALAEIVYEAP